MPYLYGMNLLEHHNCKCIVYYAVINGVIFKSKPHFRINFNQIIDKEFNLKLK